MGARTKAILLAAGLAMLLPARSTAQYPPGEPPLAGTTLPPPRPLPPAVPAPGQVVMPSPGTLGGPMGFTPDGMPIAPFGSAAPATPAVDPPVPSVAIHVRVNAQAQPDQDIEYQIDVENCSRAAAHHVIVSDPVPATATFVRADPSPTTPAPKLTWNLGTLAPYARKKILVVLKPTGSGDVETCARVQFEHGQRVRTRLARPSLRLRLTGPATVHREDAVHLNLEVTNTGQARAADVVVKPELPDGLEYVDPDHPDNRRAPEWKVGTLEPGQTKRHEISALARGSGKLIARAIARTGGAQEEASTTIVVGEARLTVIKTGPRTRSVKRPTPYLITVMNTGNAPATHVKLIDDLGQNDEGVRAHVEFQSATANGAKDGPSVKWLLGTLQPGERRTVQLVVRVNEEGGYKNLATASADHGLSAKAESPQTRFTRANNVVIEIDKEHDPVEVGQETSYVVRVWNAGDKAANGLGTQIVVPSAMQVVGTPSGRTAVEQSGQTIRFAPLGTLSPGDEAEFKLRVRALHAGPARLSVELTSKDLPAPLTGEDTTTIEPSGPPAPPRPSGPAPAAPLMPSAAGGSGPPGIDFPH